MLRLGAGRARTRRAPRPRAARCPCRARPPAGCWGCRWAGLRGAGAWRSSAGGERPTFPERPRPGKGARPSPRRPVAGVGFLEHLEQVDHVGRQRRLEADRLVAERVAQGDRAGVQRLPGQHGRPQAGRGASLAPAAPAHLHAGAVLGVAEDRCSRCGRGAPGSGGCARCAGRPPPAWPAPGAGVPHRRWSWPGHPPAPRPGSGAVLGCCPGAGRSSRCRRASPPRPPRRTPSGPSWP